MVQVNSDYLKLKAGYLFPEISRRIKDFNSKNPNTDLIRLGIGDVTEPLPLACRNAMKTAIDEMGTESGFHGYGPEQGYDWLREVISKSDLNKIEIAPIKKNSTGGANTFCSMGFISINY